MIHENDSDHSEEVTKDDDCDDINDSCCDSLWKLLSTSCDICDLKLLWICSSVFPFVSGTVRYISTVPANARTAKVRYDPEAPIRDSRVGENFTTRNEQSQLNDAHSDDEVALDSFEKSSALSTQGSGPIPME